MSSLLTHEVQKKDFHWKNRNIQGPILKINKQITKGRKRGRKGGKERKEAIPETGNSQILQRPRKSFCSK